MPVINFLVIKAKTGLDLFFEKSINKWLFFFFSYYLLTSIKINDG